MPPWPPQLYQAYVESMVGGPTDQGNSFWSAPPVAAKFHSASVGRRLPSHAQKANATYQERQLIGSDSLLPISVVQV